MIKRRMTLAVRAAGMALMLMATAPPGKTAVTDSGHVANTTDGLTNTAAIDVSPKAVSGDNSGQAFAFYAIYLRDAAAMPALVLVADTPTDFGRAGNLHLASTHHVIDLAGRNLATVT